MGNVISGPFEAEGLYVAMNNGVTDVVLSLLMLSMADSAETDGEVAVATAFGCADQAIFGNGCVGFDIRDLPWTQDKKEFEQEKAFVQTNIALARTGHRADVLEYTPGLDFIAPCFAALDKLVNRLEFQHIVDWPDTLPLLPTEYGAMCAQHKVYVHEHGCLICNN